MRKTKAEAQKTRELLLQTALDTFLEHGVSKTTLQTIAKNAGVTRGALYWHFKNKEDLLGTLLQQCFDSFQSSFSDDPDTLAPLCQALKNLFTHLQHNNQQRKLCIILNLKCEHTEENRAITELHRRYIDLWRQRFHNLLQQSVEQGELPADLDPTRAVLYLDSIIGGLINIWLHRPDTDLDQTAPPLIETAIFTLKHCPSLRKTD